MTEDELVTDRLAFARACGFAERSAPADLPLPATWVLAELAASRP